MFPFPSVCHQAVKWTEWVSLRTVKNVGHNFPMISSRTAGSAVHNTAGVRGGAARRILPQVLWSVTPIIYDELVTVRESKPGIPLPCRPLHRLPGLNHHSLDASPSRSPRPCTQEAVVRGEGANPPPAGLSSQIHPSTPVQGPFRKVYSKLYTSIRHRQSTGRILEEEKANVASNWPVL
jgi:hypothetical protein